MDEAAEVDFTPEEIALMDKHAYLRKHFDCDVDFLAYLKAEMEVTG